MLIDGSETSHVDIRDPQEIEDEQFSPAQKAVPSQALPLTAEALAGMEALRVVNVDCRIQVLFGILDSDGNIVQKIQLPEAIVVLRLDEAGFAAALGTVREVRAGIERDLARQVKEAREAYIGDARSSQGRNGGADIWAEPPVRREASHPSPISPKSRKHN